MMHKEKVLLLLLPFWTPLNPPLGLACLKTKLQEDGHQVKAVDANVEPKLWEIYTKYFELLRGWIPPEKQGNYLNIGQNVLRNHLMAHLNYSDWAEYVKLLQRVIYEHFYVEIAEEKISQLEQIVELFYTRLREYLVTLLKKEEPTVVGLSVYTGSLAPSVFAFKLVKEYRSDILTVMGGGVFADQLSLGSPNFEAFLAKTPFIDQIVVGEGEHLFQKLLAGELNPEARVHTLADIGHKLVDIDETSLPDFSDFHLEQYPQMAAYASRSCPFQCSFCSETVQWGKYRKKRAKKIADELLQLYERHGYQLFLFGDSLLNLVVTDLAEELLKRETSIYWDGYLRADPHVCNTENTILWRRGGFYRARLGVESGSEHVLEMMGKKIKPEQIKSAISALAYAGIKTTTYWVIGHPGETEEDFKETLDLIAEMKDDIYEAECNPFNYFVSGQVGSDYFASQYTSNLLYPEQDSEMLLTQTWTLQAEPSREETYRRVSRFIAHCRELGIPNPYSMREIYSADERWKKLHKNSVPAMVEFKNRDKYLTENRHIHEAVFASVERDEGDFDF